MLKRLTLVAGVCLGLASCGTTAQNSDVGLVHTGLNGRATIESTGAVEVVETGPGLSATTERVSGHSCRNKMWDPPPSRDNAIALMKQQAQSKGYDAVHSVKVINDPAAIAKNCWSALIATGIAFKKPAATP